MALTQAVDERSIAQEVEARLDALNAPDAPPERWKVDGRGTADWAARKRLKALEELASVRAEVAAQRELIMEAIAPFLAPVLEFEASETERLEREIGHWEAVLMAWHRELRSEDDTLTSVKLPHATLRSRKTPDKWTFTDEFIDWAKSTDLDVLRVKTEVVHARATAELDAWVQDDGSVVSDSGEVVPGVSVTAGEITFKVEQEVAS